MDVELLDSSIVDKLRCPRSGAKVDVRPDSVVSPEAGVSYGYISGVPDLRVAPDRLLLDLPWYEPWDEIDSIDISAPEPIISNELPYHLDGHLAAVPGLEGDGEWVLEVGCGERQCERWFKRQDFNYVGTDVDVRGIGPHLLADAHNLPFSSESFDFYTSMAVYEHLVSPLTAACEAFRVLKPGGVFFGSSAFVYGFHDRASFHHMSHGGLFWVLRSAGFRVERMWPDWAYPEAISEMAFRGGQGAPWRAFVRAVLQLSELSFVGASQLARRITSNRPLDIAARRLHTAGSVSFVARKPDES